ncbi:MAG: hypothetical protein ACWA5P_04980 [bacterium]
MRVLLGMMSVLFIMACVDPKVTIEKKENKMNEEKKYVYYDSPIQNYEEYVASPKFVLPICETNPKDNVVYLKDGTKIAYSCPNSYNLEFVERVYNGRKEPFKEVYKRYDGKTKQLLKIASFMGKGAGIGHVGIHKEYNQFGKVIKEVDYSKQQGKLGFRYMLEWADKEGYIDLERGKLLRGSQIHLDGYKFNGSLEKSFETYIERENPTEKQKKAFLASGPYVWSMGFVFKNCTVTYEFAEDGTILSKHYTPPLEMLDHAIMNKDAVHDFTGCEEEW